MTTSQPPRATSILRLSIVLSETISDKPTEKVPAVHCTVHRGCEECVLDVISLDVERPRIAADDGAFEMVDAGMVVAIGLDEEAWLAELWRVIAPGGRLLLSVPAGGPLAWLDADNLYRYLSDMTGRGTPPSAPLPTGWNRHYQPDEIRHLVVGAGFRVDRVERAGPGLSQIPTLMGLVAGDFLAGDPRTERRIYPARRWLERLDHRIPLPAIGKVLKVSATRP